MKNTLSLLLFLFLGVNFLMAQATDCCENICDNINLYGDSNENAPTRIKHYNGSTYLTGTVNIANQSFATFSKLDIDNQVVWEYRFDMECIFFDFIKIDSEFLLVGSTTPFSIGGSPTNNQSVLARIDDNGNPIYIRSYQNTGREFFYRILQHPNPINNNSSYYVVGIENIGSSASFDDRVHLHNLDAVGNIVWSVEYDASQNDEQFYRDMVATSDGNLLLVGNYLPADKGVLLKINGGNGQVLSAKQANSNVIYNGVEELSNGNIVVTGFFLGNPRETLLSLFDSNLNFSSSTRLNNGGVLNITSIDKDNNDNIYGAGELNNGQPVIIKAEVLNNQFDIVAAKYFTNGENAFVDATIHIEGANVYYADGRANHPFSFGGSDILVGYFDTDFSDDCMIDAQVVLTSENYSFSDIGVTMLNFTAPTPANNINLTTLTYSNEELCDDSGCNEPPSEAVPTLNEWGLIIFSLLLLIVGIVGIREKNKYLQLISNNL